MFIYIDNAKSKKILHEDKKMYIFFRYAPAVCFSLFLSSSVFSA